MNIGVELIGSGTRPINLGLHLLGREASLLRRQLLPAGAGSKLEDPRDQKYEKATTAAMTRKDTAYP